MFSHALHSKDITTVWQDFTVAPLGSSFIYLFSIQMIHIQNCIDTSPHVTEVRKSVNDSIHVRVQREDGQGITLTVWPARQERMLLMMANGGQLHTHQ